ncbi:uncharacterized protein C21orf62 homolog [Thalassophryne amazonica]|uniref:uncharacterized protein C21orf62 homolog n=1 Tax=Thalassophryne amazonica TaxID=390379 RepID=UPI0014722062|nr:uncharacterized protein C21orf62 homolog [Thalassophryne amazonica]XP_034042548.1 uncharacterized protein C21orf62 homolog [Thalassophryne amazonica]
MVMSPNKISFALLPWLLQLLLLFFLCPVAPTTSSTPSSETLAVNTTLLFDSGAPSYSLRNCSCATPVRDCNEALANLMCSCHTVLRSALPPAGMTEPKGLSVWLKELWILEELVNRSIVSHLQLSFCGPSHVDSQHLVLFGLRTLKIHSAAPEALYPNQEIKISTEAAVPTGSSSSEFSTSILHMAFVDLSVLNGLSILKAYSMVGPSAPTLSEHLPHLAMPILPPATVTHDDAHDDTHDVAHDPRGQASESLQTIVITFVY